MQTATFTVESEDGNEIQFKTRTSDTLSNTLRAYKDRQGINNPVALYYKGYELPQTVPIQHLNIVNGTVILARLLNRDDIRAKAFDINLRFSDGEIAFIRVNPTTSTQDIAKICKNKFKLDNLILSFGTYIFNGFETVDALGLAPGDYITVTI